MKTKSLFLFSLLWHNKAVSENSIMHIFNIKKQKLLKKSSQNRKWVGNTTEEIWTWNLSFNTNVTNNLRTVTCKILADIFVYPTTQHPKYKKVRRKTTTTLKALLLIYTSDLM